MNNSELFITPLIANLGFLHSLGFEEEKSLKFGDGKILHTWSRSREWKIEKVKLFYYKNPKWCELSYAIYVPLGSTTIELVTQNLGMLLHNKRQYSFPGIFGQIRSKNFVQELCCDVEASIGWFDNMRPLHCLNLLQSSDELIQISQSNPHYPEVVELLKNRTRGT